MMVWLTPLLVSFVFGVVFVPAVRSLALRLRWVAQPKSDRWHSRPTALMGGVAICAAVLCGMASATLFGALNQRVWGIVAGGVVLCALGAVDDRLHVKPATKIVAQLVAGAIVISFGYQTRFFELPVLNIAASFLWIVAITNAVNLLDNMDGLAAGVVAIAAAYLGWTHAGAADPAVTALALALVGALGAFLIFNVNPASIFMGDSGSMFIGFLLAVLSLSTTEASNVLSFVAVPAMTLLVPILDTTLVTVTRILRGRSIAEGGRDHASHRLVRLGLSEREAVDLLWLLAVIAGGAASVTRRYSLALGLAVLPAIIVGFALVGVYLSRLSLVDEEEVGSAADRMPAKGYVRLALDLSYKRRVLEVLLDFVLVVACYYVAYGLRFDFDFTYFARHRFYDSLPVIVAATLVAFFYQGVYRGVWSYVGMTDLLKYGRACALAVLLALATTTVVFRFESLSRSVFVIYGLLLFLSVGGTRFSFRMMDESLNRRRPGRAALVIGAGAGGEIAAHECLRNPDLGLRVVGFADDDSLMHGRLIHGYPVLGGTHELGRLHEETAFEEILVSTRKVSAESLVRVRAFSRSRAMPLRFLRIELLEPEIETVGTPIGKEAASALTFEAEREPLMERRWSAASRS
jgi:UDP-GlcNAc:undecaprenyl-phosphate/decaprenyl-phosphate GlcNAc-1-phosphate transferase